MKNKLLLKVLQDSQENACVKIPGIGYLQAESYLSPQTSMKYFY